MNDNPSNLTIGSINFGSDNSKQSRLSDFLLLTDSCFKSKFKEKPDHIQDVLQLLETRWRENPELRLGELLINFGCFRADKSLPYLEDEDIVEMLQHPISSKTQIL